MNSALSNLQPSKNDRSEPRKILRGPATLLRKNQSSLRVRTVDISTAGIAIIGPENIAQGQLCGISLATFVNGNMAEINAVGKVVYSICVGTTGFRIGMHFTEVEAAGQVALTQLMTMSDT
jgi:c-di-GMP-binding flagellar brake protein YcgR